VLVDGKVIGTETLPLEPARLIDLEHPVPASLTRGRSSVTVTYRPHTGSQTGAVYEIRTITRP
jgi:hypothetical protein